jgi:hypothetical protein
MGYQAFVLWIAILEKIETDFTDRKVGRNGMLLSESNLSVRVRYPKFSSIFTAENR